MSERRLFITRQNSGLAELHRNGKGLRLWFEAEYGNTGWIDGPALERLARAILAETKRKRAGAK